MFLRFPPGKYPFSEKTPFSSEGAYRLNLRFTSGSTFSGVIPMRGKPLEPDEAVNLITLKVLDYHDITPLSVGMYDDVIAATTVNDGQPCAEPLGISSTGR